MRESGVYCEIFPSTKVSADFIQKLKPLGIILSGGPASVLEKISPKISVDIYDLEGPESNKVTEKSSFGPPETTISIIAGGYTIEGSGRNINLEWLPEPGVENYALYRDGELMIKQSQTKK